MKKHLPKLTSNLKQLGFTMIELLIVISILGILAVAVLSAINPIEQINRGKDTGSQSDAEQLISAIDRYYASNGTYPWQGSAAGASSYPSQYPYDTGLAEIGTAHVYASAEGVYAEADGTLVLDELKNADEIKTAFVERLSGATNQLTLYYDGTAGDSVYACFKPQSKDFRKKAAVRCGNANDATVNNIPSDLDDVIATVCDTTTAWTGPNDISEDIYTCLP